MSRKMGYIFPKRIKDAINGEFTSIKVSTSVTDPEIIEKLKKEQESKLERQKVLEEARNPWFCPKCKKLMRNRNDSKFWRKTGKCMNCVIEEEELLRTTGKYKEYEVNKMMNNFKAFLKDSHGSLKDYINTLSNKVEIINEDGTIETFKGDNTATMEFFKNELKNIEIQLEIIESENPDEAAFIKNCECNYFYFVNKCFLSNENFKFEIPTDLVDMINMINNNSSIYIKHNESKQIDTLVLLYIVWKVLFSFPLNCTIIVPDRVNFKLIRNMITVIFEILPACLQNKFEVNSSNKIEFDKFKFENGSSIEIVFNGNISKCDPIDLLCADNIATIDKYIIESYRVYLTDKGKLILLNPTDIEVNDYETKIKLEYFIHETEVNDVTV